MTTWRHKLAAIFYGPSWQPGKPRLGLEEDKVKVVPRPVYDVRIPLWCNIYLLIHFSIMVYGFHLLAVHHVGLNPLTVLTFVIYIIGSLTAIGMLFDNKPNACVFELCRCMVLVTLIQRMQFININENLLLTFEIFFVLSGLFWFLQSIKVLQISSKIKLH
ncbi:unnamed protein product [Acanthoscelides obtectus]|nr:unnamed protein product [Acanthoscelides obtectus]CAK1663626.1 Alkylglycerol monooxygenase [Acanthoscelides obtectus]